MSHYPNFCGSAYTAEAKTAAADRSINLYVEVIESGTGKDSARMYLAGTPGTRCLVTLPDAPLRGLYSGDGRRVFAVAGRTLCEITTRAPVPCRLNQAELRTLLILDSGGTPSPLQTTLRTADQWGASYTNVTGENAPDPTTYGFSDAPADGKLYPRNQTVAVDQWLALFLATDSYHVLATIQGNDGQARTRVQMFANGNQLFLVSGAHGYVFTGTDLKLVTDAVMGAYIDGYFLALNPDGTQFHISALYDGTSWNGLDYGGAEGEPDATVAILADHRELWLFGQQSIELDVNDGNPNFPFERNPGGFIEQGCGAPWSPVKLDNTVFWLGSDERGGRILWRAQGYTPSRASNHAVEAAWAKYSRVDDAEAFGYQENGHGFYVIHFPSANSGRGATWVYDCAASAQLGTPQWHERLYWDPVRGLWSMWRARCHAYARNTHFVGDWQSGKVYALDPACRTDDGNPLRWLRSAPHISTEMLMMYYDELLVDMQVGLGLNDDVEEANTQTAPEAALGINDTIDQINAHVTAGNQPVNLGQAGQAPQVCMRFSNDGGRTWSNERRAAAGAIGAFLARVRFTRLGRARDRVFEVSGSDPVPVALINASIRVTPGNGS